MAHDVFISYAGEDKAAADAVCAALEAGRCRCWIAPRDVQPSDNWSEAIVSAILQSRLVVLLLSRHANGSPYVPLEAERATGRGIPILPVRVEDVLPGPSLELFLSARHWFDALPPPVVGHLPRLVAAVRGRLTGTGVPVAVPDRPIIHRHKVCLLGSYAVGKTSLVRRFVSSMYSDSYYATLGVRIDKKTITIGQASVALHIWDVAGEEESTSLPASYLAGSQGFLLVVDGTRPKTLDVAVVLAERAERVMGPVPFVALLNKADLADRWALDEATIDDLVRQGWTVVRTSAKTGENVEQAFHTLATRIVGVPS